MPIFDRKKKEVIVQSNMSGMLLCNGGNANLLINGKEFNVSRGALCLVSPFRLIEIVSTSDDCKWEIIFDDKDLFYPVAKIALYAIKNNFMVMLDETQTEAFLFYVKRINDKQLMVAKERTEENVILLMQNIASLKQTAVEDFLVVFVLEQKVSQRKLSRNEKLALNFCKSINKNYITHHDVGWYAEQANLSTVYFTRIVRQCMGYTPALIIKHFLVVNAKILLAQGELSVKEIATRFNFSSQFAFCRYFKNCTGMSPTEYRDSL